MNKKPLERLEKTAFHLFYKLGYPDTSMVELLKESGSFRKSFYRYFSNKKDLGNRYILMQKEYYLTFFTTLTQKYFAFEDFWPAWIKFLKKNIRNSTYRGCPFANLTNQTYGSEDNFSALIKDAILSWQELLQIYFTQCTFQQKNISTEQATFLSKHIMVMYEGALQMYTMTQDKSYIELLEKDVLKFIQNCVN